MKITVCRNRLIQLLSGAALLLGAAGLHAETPHIFWASDPVGPDETVLVQGSEFEGAKVELKQLGRDRKWSTIPVAQGSESSLKFIVPANWKQGVYALKVTGKDGKSSKEWLINSPDVWWTQGDEGEAATPGGWLRAFGKSLNFGGKTMLRLTPESGKQIELTATKADAFAATFEIPSNLKHGMYQAAMHNGLGGDAAWREIATVQIDPPVQWPQEVFSVLDSYGEGAKDRMKKSLQRYQKFEDRMEGVRAALAKAKANGGGIVYFPTGKYLITEKLEIPPKTVLRGDGDRFTLLWWAEKGLESKFGLCVYTDPDKDVDRLGKRQNDCIAGTDLGIENMALYVPFKHENAVVATGRFRMDGVLMRVDRAWLMRGPDTFKMEPDQWLIRTANNYRITNSDLMAAKTGIFLGNYGVIANNRIAANKSPLRFEGGREVILEENRFFGTSPLTFFNIIGGGRHIFIARNRMDSFFGPQGGIHFTADLSPATHSGPGCEFSGIRVTLPEDPRDPPWPKRLDTTDPIQLNIWKNPILVVQNGRGAGQWRNVVSFEGKELVLDRPFEVVPDAGSFVMVLPGILRWLLVDNVFEDCEWVVPGYDVGIDVITAGNKLYNCAEMLNYGGERLDGLSTGSHGNPEHLSGWPGEPDPVTGLRPVRPYSPNWYFQYFDNEHHRGNTIVRTSGGFTNRGPVPVTRCTVHRRHRFIDNAGKIVISNTGNRDVVVEGCELSDPISRIEVSEPEGVLLRNNRFAVPPEQGYIGKGLDEAMIRPEWSSQVESRGSAGSGLKDALILPPLKP
jgi:hypothetical protein